MQLSLSTVNHSSESDHVSLTGPCDLLQFVCFSGNFVCIIHALNVAGVYESMWKVSQQTQNPALIQL